MKYVLKENLKNVDINLFIEVYFDKLQGAAVFVKNDKKKVSNIVSKVCKNQLKNSKLSYFVPAHIASCYKEKNDKLFLLDIKPPKSTKQPLAEYLRITKDDYVIFFRQEEINLNLYNYYMQNRIGLWYGLISAMQSVFKHITFKHGMHCSENWIYAYNQQGLYYDINANKSTPANLLCYLLNKYGEKDENI